MLGKFLGKVGRPLCGLLFPFFPPPPYEMTCSKPCVCQVYRVAPHASSPVVFGPPPFSPLPPGVLQAALYRYPRPDPFLCIHLSNSSPYSYKRVMSEGPFLPELIDWLSGPPPPPQIVRLHPRPPPLVFFFPLTRPAIGPCFPPYALDLRFFFPLFPGRRRWGQGAFLFSFFFLARTALFYKLGGIWFPFLRNSGSLLVLREIHLSPFVSPNFYTRAFEAHTPLKRLAPFSSRNFVPPPPPIRDDLIVVERAPLVFFLQVKGEGDCSPPPPTILRPFPLCTVTLLRGRC